uniref:AlNc14C45G3666 protein n=1 Tax=Albugo laibachii Nc14 TaxID=890382 RepID=F0WAD6_9STRA|nr:AlNc14C45G3666 [Albugo laibachii Nc14]|eukprot:CCA18107.1 AlNc14C45G3666 [Albugo laibachii Nc14]
MNYNLQRGVIFSLRELPPWKPFLFYGKESVARSRITVHSKTIYVKVADTKERAAQLCC